MHMISVTITHINTNTINVHAYMTIIFDFYIHIIPYPYFCNYLFFNRKIKIQNIFLLHYPYFKKRMIKKEHFIHFFLKKIITCPPHYK